MLLSYFDNLKSGEVVLFVHGTASAKEIWERQYDLLSKSNFRVIGVDLRGHGKSKNPGGVCNIDDHINDLKETLDYLSVKNQITIVGHSFGAVLATYFAERYPHMVSKLLLVSLPVKMPKILLKYYKWFLDKPVEFLKRKLNLLLKLPLRKRYKLALSSDINIIRQIYNSSLDWDFISAVPKIKCPVYLSVGRFDYVALKSIVRRLHKVLPNSCYKVFNWASHTCMEDTPHEFNKWVLATLNP